MRSVNGKIRWKPKSYQIQTQTALRLLRTNSKQSFYAFEEWGKNLVKGIATEWKP